jgi:hypothetical protein
MKNISSILILAILVVVLCASSVSANFTVLHKGMKMTGKNKKMTGKGGKSMTMGKDGGKGKMGKGGGSKIAKGVKGGGGGGVRNECTAYKQDNLTAYNVCVYYCQVKQCQLGFKKGCANAKARFLAETGDSQLPCDPPVTIVTPSPTTSSAPSVVPTTSSVPSLVPTIV